MTHQPPHSSNTSTHPSNHFLFFPAPLPTHNAQATTSSVNPVAFLSSLPWPSYITSTSISTVDLLHYFHSTMALLRYFPLYYGPVLLLLPLSRSCYLTSTSTVALLHHFHHNCDRCITSTSTMHVFAYLI